MTNGWKRKFNSNADLTYMKCLGRLTSHLCLKAIRIGSVPYNVHSMQASKSFRFLFWTFLRFIIIWPYFLPLSCPLTILKWSNMTYYCKWSQRIIHLWKLSIRGIRSALSHNLGTKLLTSTWAGTLILSLIMPYSDNFKYIL